MVSVWQCMSFWETVFYKQRLILFGVFKFLCKICIDNTIETVIQILEHFCLFLLIFEGKLILGKLGVSSATMHVFSRQCCQSSDLQQPFYHLNFCKSKGKKLHKYRIENIHHISRQRIAPKIWTKFLTLLYIYVCVVYLHGRY